MTEGPPVCEDAQFDSGAWLHLCGTVTKSCEVLCKLLSNGDRVKDQSVKSSLTSLRMLRPVVQKKHAPGLLPIIDELSALLTNLQNARNGLCVSTKKCPNAQGTAALLAPVSQVGPWLHAAFPVKWVKSWVSHRIAHLHGQTSSSQPDALCAVILGSKAHFGTVLDALAPADADKALAGQALTDDGGPPSDLQVAFLAVREEAVVDGILKQCKPPIGMNVDAAVARFGEFIAALDKRAVELQLSPEARSLVAACRELDCYDSLSPGDLREVVDVFTAEGSAAQAAAILEGRAAGLQLLRNGHKGSVVLKKLLGFANKKLTQNDWDDRLQPQAEKLEADLDDVEKNAAGTSAATDRGAAGEPADLPMMLLAFANRLDALLSTAQRSLGLDNPASRWAGLFKRAKTVITQQATSYKGDLLYVACRAVEAANAAATGRHSEAADAKAADPDAEAADPEAAEAADIQKGQTALLGSLKIQCHAWDSKIKNLSPPAKTLLDAFSPIVSGRADFPDFLSRKLARLR